MNLDNDGFTILRGAIPKTDLLEIRQRAAELLSSTSSDASVVCAAMERLERSDKDTFYRFCVELGSMGAVRRVAGLPAIVELVTSRFDGVPFHVTDLAAFFNHKEVTRLQYAWHHERSYYTNSKEVVTLWFPWLHAVGEHNGTMIVAGGSHKHSFDARREDVKDGLTQMHIDPSAVERFEQVHCNLELGDAVLFLRDTVHRTGENASGSARTTMIVRYVDAAAVPL